VVFLWCIGEVRNDVYLELHEGDFDRDGKKAQKNVEVRISVLDKEGRRIPVSSHADL
jgi:hypothetical protein